MFLQLCHSRAGGNLFLLGTMRAIAEWVPACAGMTWQRVYK